ncbi:MAG: ATP-binding protein [Gaiellales bacterium]
MSLRTQLLAAFAYVLLLVVIALEVPLALNVSRRIDAEVRAQASSAAHLVAASASGRLDASSDLERLVERAADDADGRVIVVDRAGSLLADSEGEGLVGTSYGARPEIRTALDNGVVAQGRRVSETLAEELLYTAVPIVEAGQRVGAVRITQSVSAIDAKVRNDILALAGIGALALAAGLGLAWVLAGSLARPLRGLAAATEQAARGDLSARAEIAGSREQQEVATAFNTMASRLGSVLEGQREFVANASHQLRTPLTGLRLRIEAASLKTSDPAVRHELDAADREAERLARLLTGLLTLVREGEPSPPAEPVSLADAARQALDRWAATADERGQRLEVAGVEDVGADASGEDVAIILDNLVENALKYSPPGGTVTISWSARGSTALLTVADEGPGLAEGEEERVFDRFSRGTAAGSAFGTGLGLAIVRTLARRWGGEARIASRSGAGALAEVTLPLAPLPNPNPELTGSLPRSAYSGER